MSSAITEGIRVTVSAAYVPEQSSPSMHKYVFAYRVRISNEGLEPATLKSRHWIITDGAGNAREVIGPGVIGESPALDPGESFEYVSGCVLETPQGTMRGTYQMIRQDGRQFDANIATFELALPYSLN